MTTLRLVIRISPIPRQLMQVRSTLAAVTDSHAGQEASMRIVRATVVVCGSLTISMVLPGVAGADPKLGSCTSSYELIDEATLADMDSALTHDLFNAIDTNHNGSLCFKPYPNRDHHGHAGNLVDDKSGPLS
jgi:hypothetical protein